MVKSSAEDILTPSEAARIIGVSVDLVRYLADKGRLPMLRTTTGRRLFKRVDVDRVAAERRAA